MPVEVCGASVGDVWDVLDVVPAEDLDVVDCDVVDVVDCDVVDVVDCDVVDVAADVEVVVEFEGDGLLEQAASASAQAGRIRRLIDHVRSALGIR